MGSVPCSSPDSQIKIVFHNVECLYAFLYAIPTLLETLRPIKLIKNLVSQLSLNITADNINSPVIL